MAPYWGFFMEGILVSIVIGAIAGWLAGQLFRGAGFGLVGNIVVGILGAVVASYLLPMVGVAIGGGLVGSIVNAAIGGIIILFGISLIKRA